MAATLSLEPLRHALPSLKSEASDAAAAAAATPDQQSLAARLQRLWQERGDFSKLSIDKLVQEANEEGGEDDKREELLKTAKDSNENVDQEAEEQQQSMSQEQLWDLKLGILQGLDLARSDITSALDLLQLLLNPLNALAPPVPEEALALPSGSMSASVLHTPLPPPAEGIHIRNTALALATKAQAVVTASDLLRGASKRLDRTTNSSQSEWTDLLRLKRSGQWKIEARPAHVPPQAGPSSAPFLPNIPIDKMAKDLCIFCGIEESAYRWRQAGLVRLNNTNAGDKGKGKEILSVPERLEGKRRMCVRLSIDGVMHEDVKYLPAIETPHEDDMHSALVQVQQELFEEEIFAELIREARDQPFGITATRNSLEIRHPGVFTLTVSMEDVEDIEKNSSAEADPSFTAHPLPHLLVVMTRLQMIQLYRKRRRSKSTSVEAASIKDVPISLTNALRQVLLYYRHSSRLKQLLLSCMKALKSSSIFGRDLSLDFASYLSSPESTLKSLSSFSMTLEGSACLYMASQSLNLSFSGSSAVTIHLPTRNLPIRNLEDFSTILKRIIKAAILKQVENTLKTVLAEIADGSEWEVLPTPKAVGKGTAALARKKTKHNSEADKVQAFVSILPTVTVTPAFEVQITSEAQASARESELVLRKTFRSFDSARDGAADESLEDWLRSTIPQL